MALNITPLNAVHRASGARMVDFGGWDMPVNYGSQIGEHQAVRQDIAAYRARTLGLALSAFDPREGWVELHNYGSAPVSTQGMVLTKDLRRAMTPNVPERTLAPGETVRFTAAELGITTSPPAAIVTPGGPVGFPARGEIGLFNGKSIVGVIDLLYYGELPGGRSYARNAQEPARWEIR